MFWVLPMCFIKLDRDIIIPWKSFTELVLCSMARPKADMLHLHKGLEIREIKCAHIISENHFSVGGGEGAKGKTITHFASWCQPAVCSMPSIHNDEKLYGLWKSTSAASSRCTLGWTVGEERGAKWRRQGRQGEPEQMAERRHKEAVLRSLTRDQGSSNRDTRSA